MPVNGSLGSAPLTQLDPKVRQAVLTRLSLCASVFQKKSHRSSSLSCADFGNTETQSPRRLISLCLCDSVFQKRATDQAAYLARTLETRRHRVHGGRSLCVSAPLCFNKEPQTEQPILRGLWKHGDTEPTEVDLSVSLRLCVSIKSHRPSSLSCADFGNTETQSSRRSISLCLCASVFQ
jgi:hypothetical protein